MESFESNCEKAFKSVITECFKTGMLNFAKAVSEKHGVELDELLELWNESNEDTFKLTKTTVKVSKSKAKAKSKDGDEKICEALVKKTGEKCTFKVSSQSSSGKYCGRHLKEEKDGDDTPKEKKTKSKTKAKTKKQKDEENDEENDEDEKEVEKKQPVKVCIKRDSFGRLVDGSSGLVFNSNKEVVGKALDDGSIGKLNEDDLKVCKKYGVVVKQKVEKNNEEEGDDE